ncbi:coiled-coil domain-containing protein 115 isoform X2 [Struthio camelus]|uniref:coiled-coil domain-containing protein 115 isoform X2 n=1 Tax=Struthio camelus TaxID=8801 RepID=UPI00360418B1
MAAEAALCGELDAAALELLEALETLQRRRDAFAACLEQARYALGCHRVSALQYGATMVPRVRVAARPGPGGAPRFEELLAPGGAPAEPPTPPAGLRQRHGAPPAPPPAPAPPRDPLTWFGILVPRSLRQAQGSFCQGVSLAVELAELQGAVTAAGARYRALLRRRRADTEAPGHTDSA